MITIKGGILHVHVCKDCLVRDGHKIDSREYDTESETDDLQVSQSHYYI